MSGCPDSPSCCMHAFYTQSRIFRNFSACSAFSKLAFCSAKGGRVGVCAVGARSIANTCSSCLKSLCSTMQTFRAVLLCNNPDIQRFWACFKQWPFRSRSCAAVQLALYGPFANSWGGLQPLLACREGQTGPAVTCMLFIPKVNFSATFRHVRPF